MEHNKDVPQSVIDEYNDRINKEVARLNAYRESLAQEYEKRVVDEADTRYRAMRVFSDNIHDVASQLSVSPPPRTPTTYLPQPP